VWAAEKSFRQNVTVHFCEDTRLYVLNDRTTWHTTVLTYVLSLYGVVNNFTCYYVARCLSIGGGVLLFSREHVFCHLSLLTRYMDYSKTKLFNKFSY